MYKISVPVNYLIVNDDTRHIYFEHLHAVKAERVFFFIPYLSMKPEVRVEWLEKLKAETELFHREGFEVGMWMWAFEREDASCFTLNRFFGGREEKMRPCIFDEDFLKDTENWIKEVVSQGVDFILFDDDTHINEAWYRGLACACPLHMKRYSEFIGREVTEREMCDRVLTGESNEYRKAWLAVNREALLGFADRVRAAVNEVNPSVRVGVCSVMSLWDLDGVDSYTYARHLAGKTRPFVRLIGAPYWAAKKQFGQHEIDVINLVRMEALRRRECDSDIETVAEGDTFPRPRTATPAAYIELFDMAFRFTGELDGLLRYSLEYTSHPEYDMGYLKIFKSNAHIYEALEGMLAGGEMTGVRIYEAPDKISDIVMPDSYPGDAYVDQLFYSQASKLAAHASLSTVYSGRGHGGIVFGHNAKMLTDEDIASGLILDLPAAIALTERGVDVGLVSYSRCDKPALERFVKTGYFVPIEVGYANEEYKVTVADSAEITSYFTGLDRRDISPSGYRYTNARGEKFAVLAFAGYGCANESFYGYERGRQTVEDIEWLKGKPADAVAYGNPEFMLLTKKQTTGLAVAVINADEDPVLEPEIFLADTFSSAEFVNCTGRLEGKRLLLDRLQPFSFAGIKLKK